MQLCKEVDSDFPTSFAQIPNPSNQPQKGPRVELERTRVAAIPTWQGHKIVCQELHITQLLRHQHYSLGEVDKWNTSICTCHAGVLQRM